MIYLKLFEAFSETEKFYYYSPSTGEEVIIRNDTQGSNKNLNVSPAPLKKLLKDMGGVDSMKTWSKVLGSNSRFKVNFAMNACLFEPDYTTTGHYIVDKVQQKDISKQTTGNFGDKVDSNSGERNGVFYGEGLSWKIEGASKYKENKKPKEELPRFAIQSGPILLLDGVINSAFNKNSPNKTIRNGIGVDSQGKPHFVISKEKDCTFYDLADFFKTNLKCDNAIYSDGNVSQAYFRDKNLYTNQDSNASLGPVIIVASR